MSLYVCVETCLWSFSAAVSQSVRQPHGYQSTFTLVSPSTNRIRNPLALLALQRLQFSCCFSALVVIVLVSCCFFQSGSA